MGPGERTIAIDRKDRIMKFVCPVCGYVEEFDGDQLPEDFKCPQCGVPGSRFLKQEEGQLEWAAEHVVGVAAHREGYPEIGLYWEKAAHEEAEHAAKFAELLGEVVTDSTKKNLEMRVEAENGATAGKTDLAKRAKAAGLDAIHDTVHEMARDEARHGKAFAGLLKRYFG